MNEEIRKILIEHIEDARYELNVILHSDNDLNYKNECSREFEILNKNIKMILDKIDNILNLDKPQENLYRYTPEKGFELVGDNNE